jgi:hypothetical protein
MSTRVTTVFWSFVGLATFGSQPQYTGSAAAVHHKPSLLSKVAFTTTLDKAPVNLLSRLHIDEGVAALLKAIVMRRSTRNMSVAAAVLTLVGSVPVRSAIAQPGPLDMTGQINGAPFRIVVPAVWNGTFIEFVRGHVDKADHPGEVDNRNPTLPPNAALLLAEGYALAGSARKANGWSVEEGLDDVLALASYFRENVGQPTSTILWGNSGGTIITLKTAECSGGLSDGYLVTCSAGAGTSRDGVPRLSPLQRGLDDLSDNRGRELRILIEPVKLVNVIGPG